ncbi:LEC14B protein-like isoform X1 [Salvia divinorum]|uniref:LEC14B protein-like isoform X1 n=1 Tax=Salvia divinorum TaxID=28513 RepID=A0ABD1HT96_SALDI
MSTVYVLSTRVSISFVPAATDSFCKVWESGKPARVLMGHLEGITFTDSRRDGRYLISNSKDQSINCGSYEKCLLNLFAIEDTGTTNAIQSCKHSSVVTSRHNTARGRSMSGAQVAKLQHHGSAVRDCGWHLAHPVLVSSSWDGEVVKWEFP